MKWKRDLGLTMRMALTMFLLLIVYLVFIAVLGTFFPGLGMGGLIAIAVGMAFLQYYFSDKLVLWSTRARIIGEDEFPDLHRMVERLAKEADIPMPRVAIMQSPVPNAFATGRSPRHAVVAVTDSIMRVLNQRELEAVIAHELSHVKNRDILTLTIASFMAMVAAIIMQNFLFASLFDRREGSPWLIVGIVAIIVYFVSQLLIMALSRYREFAADRGSAYITGRPDDLISALTKISGRMDYLPKEAKAQVEGANAFFIIPALSGNTLMELFSTHPPLEKRIAALEKVGMEMQGS